MNPYIAWPRSAKVASVLFIVLAVGFLLTTAKAVLVPMALAVLVSFLLHPAVKKLHRWGIPRIASVLLVVVAAALTVGSVGYVVSSQLKSFADELPTHEANIEQKLLAVKSLMRGGTIDAVKNMLRRVNRRTDAELEKQSPVETTGPKTEPEAPKPADTPIATAGQDVLKQAEAAPLPITAEPVDSSSDALSLSSTAMSGGPIVTSALDILANAGLVILLVTFFLIQQADIRDRIVGVAGRGALATTTKALEEAGARISRYLLMLFVVNATFGISVAIGLAIMKVPYAIMWGLAAGTLRYIPYVGPWIAAALPIAVSLATSQGWWQPLMVVGLFLVLELLSNNVMEPVLYGHSVGISELGIILAAIVWAWLWGPIGLVLATPMTVCLVVLGRYVPGLRIFDQLLGERADVGHAVRLYQRLLAKDIDDVEDLVESYMKDHSLVETADELILPAIELVRHDHVHDQIDDLDSERMNAALRTLIADLAEDAAKTEKAAKEEHSDEPRKNETTDPHPVVVGIAAQAGEEVLLLEMLQATFVGEACTIEVLSNELLHSERLAAIEEHAPAVVVISALPPGDLTYARQLCKRLKAARSSQRIIVARWGKHSGVDRSEQLLSAGADEVVSTMAELHRLVATAVQFQRTARIAPPAGSATAPDSRPATVQAT